MPVKKVQRHDGKVFRFGKKRASGKPHLKLKDYIKMTAMPAPPASINYGGSAVQALSQMYNNDSLGDCVIAGIQHVQGVLTSNVGSPLLFSEAQTVDFYSKACGYVVGDESTDNGCDVISTLQYWQKNGNPAGTGHNILGLLSVDPTNLVECKTALWLFENLIFGVELPDKWINPFPSASGFVWGTAANPDANNGHCFVAFGYEPNGSFDIVSWGMTGFITSAAIAKYAADSAGGELYTVISKDQLNQATRKAPNGIDWSTLVSDWDAMGGMLPAVPPEQQVLGVSFQDQNDNPMLVQPVTDGPPTWVDKNGTVTETTHTVALGVGNVSVSVKVDGKQYDAKEVL